MGKSVVKSESLHAPAGRAAFTARDVRQITDGRITRVEPGPRIEAHVDLYCRRCGSRLDGGSCPRCSGTVLATPLPQSAGQPTSTGAPFADRSVAVPTGPTMETPTSDVSMRVGRIGAYAAVPALATAFGWGIDHDPQRTLMEQLARSTGLGAMTLLVVALVLPSRLDWLISSLGIESILRGHRVVAVSVTALVAAHLLLVLASDPRGVSILDLRDTTSAAWAAIISTIALGVVVVLAFQRKRRRPRYEGWRMAHIALAFAALLTSWLHVWWLGYAEDRPLVRAWLIVLTAIALGVVLHRWLWRPLCSHRRSYLVEEIRVEGRDVVTVVLRAHLHSGMDFEAGQFAWLKIGSSPFVFEEHPFTIASTAESPHRKEFTIKASGDFTQLLRGLRPGRRVFLDGPYGSMTTENLESSTGFVMIAGGVGITPMLSILRTLRDRADDRPHYLLVGARTEHDLMMRSEIYRLRHRLNLTVTEVVASPSRRWGGETGRIDAALLKRRLPPLAQHYDFFLCGPPPMVIAVSRALRARGIPAENIHTEQFESI